MSKMVNSPLQLKGAEGAPRVLTMRHAQTAANVGGYFLGSRDEGVTEEGLEQSRRAVAGLVAWKPDRIICSPLRRCRKFIAEPAARELGIEAQVEERLTEFDFGPLEGKHFIDIVTEGLPFPWGPTAGAWPPAEGGESMEHFAARLKSVTEEIEQLEGRTAIIAHGGVIRGLLAAWLGLGPAAFNQIAIENVSSFMFRVQPGNVELEAAGLKPELLGAYGA